MGLLETLQNMIPTEAKIQGVTPKDAAAMVDLSVAYTPVLAESIHNETMLGHCIPVPVRVQKDGARYCLMFDKDYRWIDVDSLKEMRARYLLVRGWYYANFAGFSHPQKQEILSRFFKGGMWRPAEGSELSKAMGLE